MLPKLARLKSGFSARGWGVLVACSFAILALPTWTQQARSQFGGGSPEVERKADNKPTAALNGVKGSTKIGPQGRGLGGPPANPQANIPSTGVSRVALPLIAPPSVEFLPQPTAVEKRILEAFDEVVEIDFTDESLLGVVQYLTDKHGLQIVIDKVSLEEESIITDATDITRKVSGITLRSALNILLKPKNLTIVIEDEVIKITTRTNAWQSLSTRTYPVRDLVGNVDVDYKLLLTTIQMATTDVANGVPWLDIDGEGGTISILPAAGCLVILATRETHDEVLKLLRAIRKANSEMQPKTSQVIPASKNGSTAPQINIQLLKYQLSDTKHYPLVGPARLATAHLKCTVKVGESDEVVYFDHSSLIAQTAITQATNAP